MRPTTSIALAATLMISAVAEASAIRYETEPYTVIYEPTSGPAVVELRGLADAVLEGGDGPIALGAFVVSPRPGTTTTYDDTWFIIGLDVPELHEVVMGSAPPGTPYGQIPITEYFGGFIVVGRLDGMIDGEGRGDLTATIEQIRSATVRPQFLDHRVFVNRFPVDVAALDLPEVLPLTRPGGGHSVALVAQVVPEPTSVAGWLAGLALFGRAVARRAASACRVWEIRSRSPAPAAAEPGT